MKEVDVRFHLFCSPTGRLWARPRPPMGRPEKKKEKRLTRPADVTAPSTTDQAVHVKPLDVDCLFFSPFGFLIGNNERLVVRPRFDWTRSDKDRHRRLSVSIAINRQGPRNDRNFFFFFQPPRNSTTRSKYAQPRLFPVEPGKNN